MDLSFLGRCVSGAALVVALLATSVPHAEAQAACQSSKDPFVNPFNKNSAHHRPIGSGAQFVGDSHPAARDWLKANTFGFNVGGPWGVDVAATGNSDVVRRVNGRAVRANDPVIGLPANVRLPRNGLITSISTNQSGNYDGVAVIHDRVAGTTHEFYQYAWNNGNPAASIHRQWDIRGLGHGTSPGQRIGVSASGVAMMFGLLRGDEINTSGRRIEHALQIVIPAQPNCNIMLSRDIQPPATTRDGHALQGGNNTGNIPYGALLALPRNVDIAGLGLSEPGRRLAQAIQSYGIYVVDTGGCGNGAVRTDQFVNSSVLNQLRADVPKIYRQIRMVINNNLSNPVAGGGTPLAPNCAFDAGATQAATAPSQPQSSSGDKSSGGTSTQQSSSPAGTLQWPATRNAQSYYLEIREGSSRGSIAFGRMVKPAEAGCSNGQGTCTRAVPPLASGKQYVWNVLAVVNGAAQSPTAWQSTSSANSSPAQSSQSASSGNNTSSKNSSAASTGSAGGALAWSAVSRAENYYVEIRDTTTARTKVYGRMVSPKDGGCTNGGTCRHAAPSLPGGKSYQWAFLAVIGGKAQALSKWQPINQSSASAASGASSNVASAAPQSQPSASSSERGGSVNLAWSAMSRADNYYVEVRDTTSRREKVHGRMAPPAVSGCANGGTCRHVVSSLPAGRSYEWSWLPVVDGKPMAFQGWRPIP